MTRSIEPYRDPQLPERFLRWIETLRFRIGSIPKFTQSTGSPEGVIAGQQGDLYYDNVGALYYVKNTNTGNTGWGLLGGGGGGNDLQQAYDAGTDGNITINGTQGAVQIQDSSPAQTPPFTLFEVLDDVGTQLFDVTTSSGNVNIGPRSPATGGVFIYQDGNQVARTLAPASGGLEVNNTLTGAGFERVLTVSDIAGSGPPFATPLRVLGTEAVADPPTGWTGNGQFQVYDSDETTLLGFMGYVGGPTLTLRNSFRGDLLQITATDSTGVLITGLEISPDGDTRVQAADDVIITVGVPSTETAAIFNFNGGFELFHNNLNRLRSTANGMELASDTNVDEANFLYFTQQDFTQRGYIGQNSDGRSVWHQELDGGDMTIRGRTAGGIQRDYIYMTAGGGVELYWHGTGQRILETISNGIIVAAGPSTSTTIFLQTPGGTTIASLGVDNAGGQNVILDNRQDLAPILFQGRDSGSLAVNLLRLTPESFVEMFFDNVVTARTAAAASGGLEANNTLTGAGFERVLTVSDIAGSGPPFDTPLDIEADILVADPPTSETPTALLRFLDQDSSTLLASAGYNAANNFILRTFFRSGATPNLQLAVDDGAGGIGTNILLDGGSNGDIEISAEGDVIIDVNGTETGISVLQNAEVRLYHNNVRVVDTAVNTSGGLLVDNGVTGTPGVRTRVLTVDDYPGGGAVPPGGADTQVQYNDGGVLGGDAAMTWDDTNKQLAITQATTANAPLVLTNDQTVATLQLNVNGLNSGGLQFNTTVNSAYNVWRVFDQIGANGFRLQFDPTLSAANHTMELVSDLSGTLMQWEADGVLRFNVFAGTPFAIDSDGADDQVLVQNGATLFMEEIAAAQTDIANHGQFWARSSDGAPMFTDNAGVDYVLNASGVSISGTPVNNQLAVWTDATTIEGDADLTFDGTNLNVGVAGGVAVVMRIGSSGGYEVRPTTTTGGWARGLRAVRQSDNGVMAGLGYLGSNETVTYAALGFGTSWWATDNNFRWYDGGSFFLSEQAASLADVAGFGQLWVDNATPQRLRFTDDAGTDETLAYVSELPAAGITQLTGDVTAGPGSGSQAATIPNDTVTNAQLANMGGLTVKARTLSGSGDPSDLVIPANTVLGRQGGAALTTAQVVTGQIQDDQVTYAKMQNVTAASRLLGRGSAAGAGDPQEITLGSGLSMSGTVLSATGGSGPTRQISTAQTAVTNSITLVTPTGFSDIALAAGTQYKVRFVGWFASNTAGTNPGYRIRLDYTASLNLSEGRVRGYRNSGLVDSTRANGDITTLGYNCGGNTDEALCIAEWTITTLTAGNLRLQFAQSTANATAIVLAQGAYLEVIPF